MDIVHFNDMDYINAMLEEKDDEKFVEDVTNCIKSEDGEPLEDGNDLETSEYLKLFNGVDLSNPDKVIKTANHNEEYVKTTTTAEATTTTRTNYSRVKKEEDGSIETKQVYCQKTTSQKLDGSCTCVKETIFNRSTEQVNCSKSIHLKLYEKTEIENDYEKYHSETCKEKYITEVSGDVVLMDEIEHEPIFNKMIKDKPEPCEVGTSDDIISIFGQSSNQNDEVLLPQDPQYCDYKPKLKACRSLGLARKSPIRKQRRSTIVDATAAQGGESFVCQDKDRYG